ncbi:MAG: dihydropteroate synthase [Anaerolineaceae bacterium]
MSKTRDFIDQYAALQSPFIIGERLNTQGSRQFKQIMLDAQYDQILPIAHRQIEQGARALDLCTAMSENADEQQNMLHLVEAVTGRVDAALCVDTTQPDVMEAALGLIKEPCILNSTHLEHGRAKADRVFELAKAHSASVIVLTIDEQGMAHTAERKLEVARKIHDIAVNDHGLSPRDLIYDTLTFTLATGEPMYENSAVETLTAIRQIKQELPGVLTSLGVSNVSYGFSPEARIVLNNIMLEQAVQYGLDLCIFNPAHLLDLGAIPADQRTLAENLIYNRSSNALREIAAYFRKLRKDKAAA